MQPAAPPCEQNPEREERQQRSKGEGKMNEFGMQRDLG
jgi:hypothetical protein